MIGFEAPLVGMTAAAVNLDRAASAIARSGQNSSGQRPSGDTVDLSAEMVAIIEDRNNFAANVSAARTIDDMTRSLLNAVG